MKLSTSLLLYMERSSFSCVWAQFHAAPYVRNIKYICQVLQLVEKYDTVRSWYRIALLLQENISKVRIKSFPWIPTVIHFELIWNITSLEGILHATVKKICLLRSYFEWTRQASSLSTKPTNYINQIMKMSSFCCIWRDTFGQVEHPVTNDGDFIISVPMKYALSMSSPPLLLLFSTINVWYHNVIAENYKESIKTFHLICISSTFLFVGFLSLLRSAYIRWR